MGRRLVAVVVLLVAAGACAGDDDATAPTTTSTTTTTVPEPDRYREAIVDGVTITSDLEYGAAPGVDGVPTTLTLDVYEPDGDDVTRRPAVVFAHGGGFGFGDKAAGVSPTLAEHFATLGYVTVSVNYRLLAVGGCSGSDAGENTCTTAALEGIHDGQAAVRWLRANAEEYGVDPERIAIGGESAGGVIATGVGTWAESPGESGTPGVSSEVQAFMSLSGSLPSCLFASEGDAPGIFFASTGDPTVPHSWSAACRDRMTELGIPNELVTYDGSVHVPFREQRDDIIDRTVAFFYEHLDLAEIA